MLTCAIHVLLVNFTRWYNRLLLHGWVFPCANILISQSKFSFLGGYSGRDVLPRHSSQLNLFANLWKDWRGLKRKQSEISHSLQKWLQKVFCTIHPFLAIVWDLPQRPHFTNSKACRHQNIRFLNVSVNLNPSNYTSYSQIGHRCQYNTPSIVLEYSWIVQNACKNHQLILRKR